MKKQMFVKIAAVAMTIGLAVTGIVPAYATEFVDVSENTLVTDVTSIQIAEDITVVPASEQDLKDNLVESAEYPTCEEVYNKIISMKSQYPEGMFFDNSIPDIYDGIMRGYKLKVPAPYNGSMVTMYGRGCAGFGFIMSDAAFGTLPIRQINTLDWDSLKPGDYLRINNDGHSVVVLERRENSIIVCEGNYNKSVHWGREISKSELQSCFTYCWTRYPEGYDPGSGTRKPVDMTKIKGFVERIYTIGLNRAADAKGLEDWSNKLASGEQTGAQVASGFFFSPEMNNRNLSDSDFVEILYKVMMNRASDAGGKKDWLNKLANGMSREGVFAGFAASTEFGNVCDTYGITRGTYVSSQARDKNPGLTAYVARLYTKALGRTYEVDGINYWCNQILSGKYTIDSASTTGFFFSDEFQNKNLDNPTFVTTLYATFFDRTPDSEGYNDWMNKLKSGTSRADVLKGFTNSQEYYNLKKSFGL